MNKILDIKITQESDGKYFLDAYLKVEHYNKMYPDNYLSTVWPLKESLFKIEIRTLRNTSLWHYLGLTIGYGLSQEDVTQEILEIRNFFHLGSFYSRIREIEVITAYKLYRMNTDELSFFSGMCSKLLHHFLEYIKKREPRIRYITLEASGEDIGFLINRKYPSLGFDTVLSLEGEEQHLGYLIEEYASVPMYAKVKNVLEM